MLYNILRNSADKNPNKIAIVSQDGDITYQHLLHNVNSLATGFLQAGIKPNDRIAFFINDCIEEFYCYFACFKIAAISVPLYKGLRGQGLWHILDETQPTIIITDNTHYPYIKDIIEKLNANVTCYIVNHNEQMNNNHLPFDNLLHNDNDLENTPTVTPDSIASIFYTSGSTAKPKGVVHTHQQILANIENVTTLFNFRNEDRCLVVGELDFNGTICSIVLPCLHNCCTLVFLPDFTTKNVFDTIINHDISIMFMVPNRYALLTQYAVQQGKFTHQLRLCITGGDTPTLNLLKGYYNCFNVPLYLGMGMTETLYQTQNFSTEDDKLGSVGLPLNTVKIKICDENHHELPIGEIGEILIYSPATFLTYWNQPDATAAVLKNSWLHSGDLGYLDNDGYLWFKGRIKNIIICNGGNVSPLEVENVIRSYTGISNAAVFGIQTDESDNAIHALIVADNPQSIDLDKLQIYLRSQLADYKVPESIHIIKDLPKNKRGKLDRNKLISIYQDIIGKK